MRAKISGEIFRILNNQGISEITDVHDTVKAIKTLIVTIWVYKSKEWGFNIKIMKWIAHGSRLRDWEQMEPSVTKNIKIIEVIEFRVKVKDTMEWKKTANEARKYKNI